MNRKAAAYTLLVWTAIFGVFYGLTFLTAMQFFIGLCSVFGLIIVLALIHATYEGFAEYCR